MAGHELHAFNYVNHGYADVRRVLLDDPVDVFRRATAPHGPKPELHTKTGAVDISTEIDIEVLSTQEASEANRRRIDLSISWKATRRAGLFPTMRATISLYPLSPTETQFELSGVYDPPMGLLGDIVDAAVLAETARATVQRFVDEVAAYLRSSASAPAARSTT